MISPRLKLVTRAALASLTLQDTAGFAIAQAAEDLDFAITLLSGSCVK